MKEFDSDLNFHSFIVKVMRRVTMAQRASFFFFSFKPADYTFVFWGANEIIVFQFYFELKKLNSIMASLNSSKHETKGTWA